MQLVNLMPNPLFSPNGRQPDSKMRCALAWSTGKLVLTTQTGAKDCYVEYRIAGVTPGTTYIAAAYTSAWDGTFGSNGLMGIYCAGSDGATVTAWDHGSPSRRWCKAELAAKTGTTMLRLYAPNNGGSCEWNLALVMTKTDYERMQTLGLQHFHGDTMPLMGGVPMFLSTPWGVDVSGFRLAVVGALRPAGGVRRPFPCGPVQATRAGSW